MLFDDRTETGLFTISLEGIQDKTSEKQNVNPPCKLKAFLSIYSVCNVQLHCSALARSRAPASPARFPPTSSERKRRTPPRAFRSPYKSPFGNNFTIIIGKVKVKYKSANKKNTEKY